MGLLPAWERLRFSNDYAGSSKVDVFLGHSRAADSELDQHTRPPYADCFGMHAPDIGLCVRLTGGFESDKPFRVLLLRSHSGSFGIQICPLATRSESTVRMHFTRLFDNLDICS